MKRSYRIGLALIMILMMVFTSAGMAFAASDSQGETKAEMASFEDKEVSGAEQGTEAEAIISDDQEDLGEIDEDADEDSPEMLKGNSLFEKLTVHYVQNYRNFADFIQNETARTDSTMTATGRRDSFGNYYSNYYIAETSVVQLKKGTLYLSGYANKNAVSIEVINNSNGQAVGNASCNWTTANKSYWNSFEITAEGSYFIMAFCKNSGTVTHLRASVAPDLQGTTLTHNQQLAEANAKTSQTKTYKLYPRSTGYMRIFTDEKSKITLCDASGKVVARQATVNYTPVFGVRANRYYLIKVAWPSGSPGMSHIKVVNGSWLPTNGVSKAKATNLTKGKAQKGLVVAGENNIRWFKFTNWQSYTKITVTGGTNDQLVWYIYEGNKQISRRIFTPSLAKMWTSFTAKRGVTYYIKVQKLTGTSSGYYHVKFE